MISKINFNAKNLTSNASLFLLLENAKSNGIFDLIENDLVFDNDSMNKIKMNHIKTMLCGHFIDMEKYGPYSFEQLTTHIQEGRIDSHQVVWRTGFPEWIPAGEVKKLIDYFPPEEGNTSSSLKKPQIYTDYFYFFAA